jgi:hypothetical protein
VDGETSIYELYTDPENHWTIRVDRERNRTHARYERGFARMECTYDGLPNGVIFVRGDINELSGPPRRRPDDATSAPPLLHRDDLLTIAAVGSIRIASDLRYQDDPRGPDGVWSAMPCTGDDRCQAKNLLALYSVEGDVRLSETSPRNMIVHAVLMAGRGSVDVTAVRQRPFNGTLAILGGKINRYEGLIDTSEKAGREGGGYKLILTYDHRLGRGLLDPPAFPRIPLIGVRAAPGLADRPTWGDRP